MHSIRTKITAITVCVIIIAMLIAAGFGVIAIKNIGKRNAEQTLLLLCETGQKNLDQYFASVEQSVEMISAYVESDLDGLDDQRLQAHLDRVEEIFTRLTYRTNGVLTYYYRIDPAISGAVKGFWYVNLDGNGFEEHAVTDIALYDTNNTSSLVWFTVPKATGRYDLARVVDPEECRILDFGDDGSVSMTGHCYGIWNSEQKCINCSSALACRTGCHQEKAERFKDQDYFNPVQPGEAEALRREPVQRGSRAGQREADQRPGGQ